MPSPHLIVRLYPGAIDDLCRKRWTLHRFAPFTQCIDEPFISSFMMNRRIQAVIPNLLSLCRLGFAGVFPFSPACIWVWLILGSGSSDALDGWLARKWKVTSWQGGLLDAVADKMFILSALGTLAYAGFFSPWWIPAVIARDITVAMIAVYAASIHSWKSFQQMEARPSGKVATAGQFFFLLAAVLFPGMTPVVLYVTVLCSLVATIDYGRVFYQVLADKEI